MPYSIFFSYSWSDLPIATRIYDDLVRSGLVVWRDQMNGSYGVNFIKEIKEIIEICDGFLLIDSVNSRNSEYVKIECDHFQSLIENGNNKRLSICSIQSPEEFKCHDIQELIKDQMTVKSYDFYRHSLYDNDNYYFEEICKLCDYWGVQYHQFTNIGEEKDFEDEISAVNLSHHQKSLLLQQFGLNYKRIFAKDKYAKNYMYLFNEECESNKIECCTPYLLLGQNLLSNENYSEALILYTKLSLNFPFDPRIWRCKGTCDFNLGNFHQSINSFQKSISLILQMLNVDSSDSLITELEKYNVSANEATLNFIKMSLAAAYFRNNNIEYALSTYLDIYKNQSYFKPLELFIGISDCYEAMENYNEQFDLLQEGLNYYPSNWRLRIELGKLYFNIDKIELAISEYELVLDRSSINIQIHAEYILMLKLLDNPKLHTKGKEAVKIYNEIKGEGLYDLGHIHFMISNYTHAKYCYDLSNTDREYYRDLWN